MEGATTSINFGYGRSLSSVVSVCSAKDIDTWAIASRFILKYITSKDYIVIVPDAEVSSFKERTLAPYRVIEETRYVGGLKERLMTVLPTEQLRDVGWYMQQFIKLSALATANNTDILLIWDADTVPLRPLSFLNSSGKLLYYRSSEHHAPYYKCISALLNMGKTVDHSFISQCFAIRGLWAREFFNFIELTHQRPWLDAIINCIDFNDTAAFSEYETLGTFVSHKYENEIAISSRQWLRFGNSLIGRSSNINHQLSRWLFRHYDYVSFEDWDTPYGNVPYLLRGPLKLLLERT